MPTSTPFARVRAVALALLVSAALTLASVAEAQDRPRPIIRDAEIEALLRLYSGPIIAAAGAGSRNPEIVIVQDSDFNAFVASGRRMVIFTGTLMQAETPNEIIGVIAHETGHLAGGHLENLRNEVARAQAIGAVVGLLGIAGAVAGMSAGSSAAAGMGQAATTMVPGITQRTVLAYRRDQELAADRAALNYLSATRQSPRGMLRVFERFADQQLLAAQYADPYAQSHPMARDRIDQLEQAARASAYWDAVDSDQLQLQHDMMRAKLYGFLESPMTVGRRYPSSDQSMPAQYARAIVAYRTGSTDSAVAAIDALIARVPNYPYFHELKGQALLEAGRPREAIAPLRRAVELAPDAGLIRIMLGHAFLATDDPALLEDAAASLRTGLDDEPLASAGYRHLATAFERQGRTAEAELAVARGLFIDGSIETAQSFARRAQAKFAYGSPGWLQADDIITYDPRRGSGN
jgi:predicted Zn-dependent protease